MNPNLKFVKVGSNQRETELPGGVCVLFSYQTPVAAFVPGRGALCTTTRYSVTTSRHIGKALVRWGATRVDVPQAEIDALVS